MFSGKKDFSENVDFHSYSFVQEVKLIYINYFEVLICIWIFCPFAQWHWCLCAIVFKILVWRFQNQSPVVSLEIFSMASDSSMCPGLNQPPKMSTRIWLQALNLFFKISTISGHKLYVDLSSAHSCVYLNIRWDTLHSIKFSEKISMQNIFNSCVIIRWLTIILMMNWEEVLVCVWVNMTYSYIQEEEVRA
jgi:hypothetical protein